MLKRPFERSAVAAADNAFYTSHPEMAAGGRLVPIDPVDPLHASYRAEWVENYKAAGGATEDTPPVAGGAPVKACGSEALLSVEITECASGKPIAGAKVALAGSVSRFAVSGAGGVADLGRVPTGAYEATAVDPATGRRNTTLLTAAPGTSRHALCLTDKAWVSFKYVVAGTQLPVHDEEPWTLVHPSGRKETGKLVNGEVRRDGVDPGVYELRTRKLLSLEWSGGGGYGEEPFRLTISSEGLPDGEEVAVEIRRLFQDQQSPPVASLRSAIAGDRGVVRWRYEQQPGEPPGGAFHALARLRSKAVTSAPETVDPWPLTTTQGVQQRLKQLSLYTGPIDGVASGATAAAIRRFQDTIPFGVATGEADEGTVDLLAATVA